MIVFDVMTYQQYINLLYTSFVCLGVLVLISIMLGVTVGEDETKKHQWSTWCTILRSIFIIIVFVAGFSGIMAIWTYPQP